ncbi:ankyrin repeat-containing domain protein [Flagelloscypha sp. PMI_526]|nr:ankyrin repeat-containing domain protein [Flagelloscypha sp. PMI_526]
MTIGQVISSHKILESTLMVSNQWTQKDHEGCTALLNTSLAEIVQLLDEKIDLDGPFLSTNVLKCFICVLNPRHAGRARPLRNYRVRASTSPDCSIRQAIHATLADGLHLPVFSIQDEHFIGATAAFANPSHELMKELPAAFPKTSGLACFVNLGISRPAALPVAARGSDNEFYRLLCCTDTVAQNLMTLCGDLWPFFFRLSTTATLEAPEDVSFVKGDAMEYLGEEDVRVQIDDMVQILMQRYAVVPLTRLRSLAAEDGKAKLNAQVEAVLNDVNHLRAEADKSIFRSIKAWLTPIDQTAKLDSCIRARGASTCGWLLDHPKIIEWQKLGGLCWFHGGMGTGKTIITSYVIETLLDHQAECIVAYYYFEFTNPSTLSEEALFRSLVAQLSVVNENISRQLYQRHRDGANQPQLATLHASLAELVRTTTLPIYVVVDALDEFPISQRKCLLATLHQLFTLTGLHAMVTSRDELDIHQAFSRKVPFDFAITNEMVRHDIAVFVDQALAVEKWTFWPNTEVQRIRDTLIQKADGMFRMVACLMEVLNQTQTTEEMYYALNRIPSTLSDTYCYILNTIPANLRARADTLLRILCVAFEPLSISELSSLLAVELGDPTDPVNLPVYREELRYHEPQNIIGLGTALVRRNEPEGNVLPRNEVVLQLSHASVKEFLLHDAHYPFSFDDCLAHETTARACLAILIHNKAWINSALFADKSYFRLYWWRHVTPNHSLQLLAQQKETFKLFPLTLPLVGKRLKGHELYTLTQTFNFSQSPLVFAAGAGLVQMFRSLLDEPHWTQSDLNQALCAAIFAVSRAEVVAALITSGANVNTRWEGRELLFYATDSGIAHLELLIENGADVNMRGGRYGSALQAAASRGDLNVVRFLVEKGADVNMQGGEYGSALQAAAQRGDLSIIRFLVEKGADVNMHGGRYGSALQAAASRRDLNILRFLVEQGADVNLHGGSYGSTLQVAAWEGSLSIVRFLIEKGADVNMQGGEYGSALQAAAQRGDLSIVQFLVEKGADVNMQGGEYGPALQAAAQRGDLSIVQFLVQKGADINTQGKHCYSPLWAAVSAGHSSIVQFLVEKGADMNMCGGYYGLALWGTFLFIPENGPDVNGHASPYIPTPQVADSHEDFNGVRSLVEKGVDLNTHGGHYGLASWETVEPKDPGALFIPENGPDVNVLGKPYSSALQVAAGDGDLDRVRFLVDEGADVNTQGGHYGSPLRAAASAGHLNIVQFLVEKGLYVNVHDAGYELAVQRAARMGDLKLVRLLIKKGAYAPMQVGNYGLALQAAAQRRHDTAVQFLVGKGAVGADILTALDFGTAHIIQ